MYRALSAGAIGIRVPFEQEVELAAAYGFHGVGIGMEALNRLGLDKVRRLLTRKCVLPSHAGLPVNLTADQDTYDKQLAALPQFCWTMTELGVERICSGITPFSDTLPYDAHFELYRSRLAPVASVLAGYGLRLGFEFIAPATYRKPHKFEFLYDINGFLALFAAVDAPNLGFVLDAWHWYQAHNTLADLQALTDDNILVVHVNDAPAGIPIDEQQDLVRELPGATGVIDIAGFMARLAQVRYTGPVLVEPFNAALNAMSPHDALVATQRSLDRIWPRL
ncbi:MAG: sugar phosphate isomerase/epimerase [Chloroflexi bacterium]|nr:sugar phosphate isomerase/epimerase [Chloroflexota bacterium]